MVNFLFFFDFITTKSADKIHLQCVVNLRTVIHMYNLQTDLHILQRQYNYFCTNTYAIYDRVFVFTSLHSQRLLDIIKTTPMI